VSDLLSRIRTALAGRYRVERPVGRGGMGTVFLAEDLKHRRQVAIKVLDPDLASALGPSRFLREIEIAASLTHPHIVPLYDSGAADGLLYYVMPFVNGESLRDRLKREIQLSVGEVVAIACETADALAFAHTQGVVHRDVKPENILLEAGHAMVADFGVARAISAAAGESLTEPGLAVGTPAYMSPEQAGGGAGPDGRSDIYALGCVVYEMLAGSPPFTGPTPQSIVARQLADPPPGLRVVRPSVPVALEAAIRTALAKVPADRFATVAQFAAALRGALTEAPPAPGSWRRRAVLAVVGAAVAALAYVALRGAAGSLSAPPPARAMPPPSSIAVLYLEDQSEAGRLAHLAAGLTEDLIDQLARVSALRVISPDGVRPYHGRPVSPDSLARRLAVGTIVTGSVRQVGDRLRVAIRLTDARTGVQLSTESFEQPFDSLLALRDRLSEEVARQLRIRVGEQVQLGERRAGTTVAEAWDLLLRAERLRDQADNLSGPDTSEARRLYRQADSLLSAAEALDPRWAEPRVARGWLADGQADWARAAADGSFGGTAALDWIGRGIRQADAALRTAPGHAEALELRGTLNYHAWAAVTYAGERDSLNRLQTAERDLRSAALGAGPTQPRALSTLSLVLHFAGKVAEANLAAGQAYEADAYLADADAIVLRLFDTSLELRRYPDAAQWCERGARTFPGDWRFRMCRLSLLAWSPEMRPDPGEAWRLLAELDSLASADERSWLRPQMTMVVAAVLAAAGLRDSAERVIARVSGAEADPDVIYYEALARARMGQREAAAALVAELLRRLPNFAPFLRGHSSLADLWTDPRLAALERSS
jgi:TolB-like protein/tetratricopeptide (TPR) repeat protein